MIISALVYYYLFYLKSVAVPSRVHADCECFYEENPPIAHLEAKASRVCGKKAVPKVQRPRSKEKPTSCRLSCSLLSIEGFAGHALPTYLQGAIPQVPVMCASLCVRFLAPFCPLCTS